MQRAIIIVSGAGLFVCIGLYWGWVISLFAALAVGLAWMVGRKLDDKRWEKWKERQ